MNYQTSQHAQTRMQQRGIPANVIHNIIAYGTTRKVPGGAVARFMSKKSLQSITRTLPKKDCLALDRHKNVYVVLASDQVITVGHRKIRFYN